MRSVLAAAAASFLLLSLAPASAGGFDDDYGDYDYGYAYDGYDDGCRFCTLNGYPDYDHSFDYSERDVSGYRPYSDTGLSGSGYSGGYYANYPESFGGYAY